METEGDISVIQPRIIDKTRASANGLCDAIIADISSEAPKRSMEAKARQVESLLRSAAQSGQRHVMIIEEAHDLTVPIMKYLKRFWELEDGFSKLLGIILIGQTELNDKLSERSHPELREFIRRCMTIHIDPLHHDMEPYLRHKLDRAGGDINRIVAPGALEALQQRLSQRYRRGGSHATPQVINNCLAKAMNTSVELGEDRVTAEIIKELWT
jgi:type II secretory pathway predicted ATPase ExeA